MSDTSLRYIAVVVVISGSICLAVLAWVVFNLQNTRQLGSEALLLSTVSIATLLFEIIGVTATIFQIGKTIEPRIVERNLSDKIIKVTERIAELRLLGATLESPAYSIPARMYVGLKEQLASLQKALETVEARKRSSRRQS